MFGLDRHFEGGEAKNLGTLGEDMGQVKLDDGTMPDAGRVMMRDQWNTAFFPRLAEIAKPQDLRIYKNRLLGIWGGTAAQA